MGDPVTHQHFELPLLLGIDALVERIRIIEVSLFTAAPVRTAGMVHPNYDDWSDSRSCTTVWRIRTTAWADAFGLRKRQRVAFLQPGQFCRGRDRRVLAARQPEQHLYRNACLAEAWVIQQSRTTDGVKRMFRKQRERFFPMPDFDLADGRHRTSA